jgi:hypothetical protein
VSPAGGMMAAVEAQTSSERACWIGNCHFATFHSEKPETTLRQPGRREKVPGEPFCRSRGIPLEMFRRLSVKARHSPACFHVQSARE